jgi:hypothetical protein
MLPLPRGAKARQLKPPALKRRSGLGQTSATPPARELPFVEVALGAHRAATTAVAIPRPDGTRRRITYHEAAPALGSLVPTFLEPRCWDNSRPRVASFWPYRPSTSEKAVRASRRCGAKSCTRIRGTGLSTWSVLARAQRSRSWPTRGKGFGCVPTASHTGAFTGGRLPPLLAARSQPGS